jgi:hypothetical protein
MRAMLSCGDVERWVKGMAWDILGHHPKFEHRDIMARPWPLPNVWLGTSPCDQATFDELVPALGLTPAAIRFLSIEPMLGPIDCGNAFDPAVEPYHPIDWVICGGESGAGARPMHPDWARSLRDQCTAAGVPFFFKQWGECCQDHISSTCRLGRSQTSCAIRAICIVTASASPAAYSMAGRGMNSRRSRHDARPDHCRHRGRPVPGRCRDHRRRRRDRGDPRGRCARGARRCRRRRSSHEARAPQDQPALPPEILELARLLADQALARRVAAPVAERDKSPRP